VRCDLVHSKGAAAVWEQNEKLEWETRFAVSSPSSLSLGFLE
jgi:hypothetical protein